MLTLVGLLAAFVTSSDGGAPSYQGTHILGQDDNSDIVSLARAAFLTTTSPDVARRVADELNEDPRHVTAGVSAEIDLNLNGLVITAVAESPQLAAARSEAFASALVASLDEQAQGERQVVVDQQLAVIAGLQAKLSATPAATPEATNVEDQIREAQDRLAEIEAATPSTAGLSTLQPAVASLTGESTSRPMRIAIGGAMGFLLGAVVALVLTRFDTRIRKKETAELAFGVPVLGEVPPLKRSFRSRKTIIAVADPESLSAEVYRGLRTALVVASGVRVSTAGEPKMRGWSHPTSDPPREKLVVVVASAGMGEGKTTTSANLAVAFAESGRSVLLLGCDLRRPELHNYFDVPATPGLIDELQKPPNERSLTNIVRDTKVPGVRIAPSGDPIEHPGELLTRGLDLIAAARDLADVVVIDTAPLLATDDASVLVPLADAVVAVCRSGRTSVEAATRARELLQRLHAPLVGVVLIGAQQLASARSYYRVDYRSRPRAKKPAPSPPGQIEVPVSADEETGTASVPSGGDSRPETFEDTSLDRVPVDDPEHRERASERLT
jgi:capsular exopolysaccharide synthesis family protein